MLLPPNLGGQTGQLGVGRGELLRSRGELFLNLQVGPHESLDHGALLLGHVLGRHDEAEFGADRFRRAVFEVLGEKPVALHHRDGFERLPGDDRVDLALLQRLVEIGAAALDVDGLEAVVGDALLDQRRGELEPDRRARRDRDLLALDVLPAVELHALAADDVFRRTADAHETDHVGRTLRQRDGEIGWADGRDVQRACQQGGAGVGVADELDELQVDAELFEFVGQHDDRRKMPDLLIAESDLDRRR